MTLMLPPLNYARSFRSLVLRVAQHVPRDACIAAPGMPRGQVAALEYHGGYRVDAATPATDSSCEFLLQVETRGHVPETGPRWRLMAREQRRNNDDEVTAIYRRRTPG
jgi:hypothetical protein